jgi:hypothetical protein
MITQVKPTNIFEYETEEAHILAMAFEQTYSLVKGLKMFGSAGEEAVYEEIEQLHNRGLLRSPNDFAKVCDRWINVSRLHGRKKARKEPRRYNLWFNKARKARLKRDLWL